LERYGFIDVECHLFHRTRSLSAADYAGLLKTYSDHQAAGRTSGARPDPEVESAITAHGGEITLHDTLDLYLARRES
jgi:hypothetical protein